MVGAVSPTSLAHRAFLLPSDDLITAVNDIPVVNNGQTPFRRRECVFLQCYLQTKLLGDAINETVLRRQPGKPLLPLQSLTVKVRVPSS